MNFWLRREWVFLVLVAIYCNACGGAAYSDNELLATAEGLEAVNGIGEFAYINPLPGSTLDDDIQGSCATFNLNQLREVHPDVDQWIYDNIEAQVNGEIARGAFHIFAAAMRETEGGSIRLSSIDYCIELPPNRPINIVRLKVKLSADESAEYVWYYRRQ